MADHEAIVRILHALDDGTRRAIVERLRDAPTSVSRLAAPLEVTLTAVAQHLKVLEDAGLVSTHKAGRSRLCRIETGGFALLEQWARARRGPWEERLDRLGEILENGA